MFTKTGAFLVGKMQRHETRKIPVFLVKDKGAPIFSPADE
jgi:hypothetical protein